MWLKLATLSLLAQTILASSSFVVQLNTGSTIQDFLNLALISTLGIKPSSTNTIQIGDFKAFVGELEESWIDELLDNPVIDAIFPNIKINFNDDDSSDQVQSIEFSRTTTTLAPSSSAATGTAGPSVDGNSSLFQIAAASSSSVIDGVTIQTNAPRHLARISSREGIYNQSSSELEYKYDSTGEDIVAYVLDTGIAINNPDFEGRATRGANFVDEEDGDLSGHGTNVAGIVGSKTYGVAKGVSIIDVKVLGQNGGTLESVLKGVEWATSDFKNNTKKAVVNMSVGSTKNDAINNAVNAAVSEGLPVIVAAGNANKNASDYSPGSAADAIVVGALDDRSDTIAIYSNWGPRVDIFASGVAVESLNYKDNSTSVAYYGTSQATPQITGLTALFLEQGIDASNIKSKLISLSTKNAISKTVYDDNSNYDDTVNRVAYNGIDPLSSDYIANPSTAEQDSSLTGFIE